MAIALSKKMLTEFIDQITKDEESPLLFIDFTLNLWEKAIVAMQDRADAQLMTHMLDSSVDLYLYKGHLQRDLTRTTKRSQLQKELSTLKGANLNLGQIMKRTPAKTVQFTSAEVAFLYPEQKSPSRKSK